MENQLYDIYEMQHIPWWQTTAFQYAVGSLIGILCLLIAVLLYKKVIKRRKKVSAWDHAINELRALQKEQVATVDRAEQFYCAVTTIIKRYLSQRYGVDCMSATDDELCDVIDNNINLAASQRNDFQAVLQGGILVKFANSAGVQEQIDRDLLVSIAVIKKTIPSKK